MRNDYVICEKLNLLLLHWQKLSVTVLTLLRYMCSDVVGFLVSETILLLTLKIVNLCIYGVATFVL